MSVWWLLAWCGAVTGPCDLDLARVAGLGTVSDGHRYALVWCRTHQDFEWHWLPCDVPLYCGDRPTAEDRAHHMLCDFWWERSVSECSCGVTRPKAPWFDGVVRDHVATVESLRTVHE